MKMLRTVLALAVIVGACHGTALAQTTSVTVTTPATAPLVTGNAPVAVGSHSVSDSGKAYPSGALVGTTDAQLIANKSFDAARFLCHATVTSSTTLASASQCYPVDASSNDVSMTVPLGSANADIKWDVQRIDGSSHVVTVQMTGGDSIDIPGIGTVSSFTIAGQFDDVTIKNISGSTKWRVQ